MGRGFGRRMKPNSKLSRYSTCIKLNINSVRWRVGIWDKHIMPFGEHRRTISSLPPLPPPPPLLPPPPPPRFISQQPILVQLLTTLRSSPLLPCLTGEARRRLVRKDKGKQGRIPLRLLRTAESLLRRASPRQRQVKVETTGVMGGAAGGHSETV